MSWPKLAKRLGYTVTQLILRIECPLVYAVYVHFMEHEHETRTNLQKTHVNVRVQPEVTLTHTNARVTSITPNYIHVRTQQVLSTQLHALRTTFY